MSGTIMKNNNEPLADESKKNVKEDLDKATDLIDDGEKKIHLIERRGIERIAGRYSIESTTFLVGVIGSTVALLLAILMIFLISGVGLITSGITVAISPIVAAFGAAISIYLWRGSEYRQLDKASKILEIRSASIMEQLQNSNDQLDVIERRLDRLPENTPEFVKENLWKSYNAELNRQRALIELMSYQLLDDEHSPNISITRRLLILRDNSPPLAD